MPAPPPPSPQRSVDPPCRLPRRAWRKARLRAGCGLCPIGLRPAGASCRRGRTLAHPLRVLVSPSRSVPVYSIELSPRDSRSPESSCERRDSYPHGLPHGILSPARLPVPPLSLGTHGSSLRRV